MPSAPTLNMCDGEQTGGQNHERQRAQPERKGEGREQQYGKLALHVAGKHGHGERNEKAEDGGQQISHGDNFNPRPAD